MIEGNLEITYVPEDKDLHFLDSIREISGYLLIYQTSPRVVRLAGLEVVRGRELAKFDGSPHPFSVAVFVNEMEYLLLPKLKGTHPPSKLQSFSLSLIIQ